MGTHCPPIHDLQGSTVWEALVSLLHWRRWEAMLDSVCLWTRWVPSCFPFWACCFSLTFLAGSYVSTVLDLIASWDRYPLREYWNTIFIEGASPFFPLPSSLLFLFLPVCVSPLSLLACVCLSSFSSCLCLPPLSHLPRLSLLPSLLSPPCLSLCVLSSVTQGLLFPMMLRTSEP